MADIKVESQDANRFQVTVTDDSGSSTHLVEVGEEEVRRFEAASAEELVEESFRFLLEREPKEAILSEFSLHQISDYFAEYPEEIRRRLV